MYVSNWCFIAARYTCNHLLEFRRVVVVAIPYTSHAIIDWGCIMSHKVDGNDYIGNDGLCSSFKARFSNSTQCWSDFSRSKALPCNTKKYSCLYERVNDIQVTWLNMNVVFTWKRLCQYGYYMWRMRYSVLGAWVGLIKEMYRRITKDHMCALVHGNMGMDILVIEHDPMHLRSLPPLCWVKLDRIEEKGIYVHGWVLINLSPYVIGSYWCHARDVVESNNLTLNQHEDCHSQL